MEGTNQIHRSFRCSQRSRFSDVNCQQPHEVPESGFCRAHIRRRSCRHMQWLGILSTDP